MEGFVAALRARAASIGLIVGFFVVWELFCLVAGISDIVLPRPTQIGAALAKYWPAIWPHTYQTLYTTLIGFSIGVVIGVLLGVLIGSSRLAYETAYPLLVGFSSIPKVAVVPIFVLWFGLFARKATAGVPGKGQAFVEMILEFIDGQVKDTYNGDRRSITPLAAW